MSNMKSTQSNFEIGKFNTLTFSKKNIWLKLNYLAKKTI